MDSQYSGIITLFQVLGSLVWIFGTIGSVLAYLVPILRSVTVYGRLMNSNSNNNNATVSPSSSSAPSSISLSTVSSRIFAVIQKYVLRWSVPKRWFTGFYIVGFIMNIFTLYTAYYGTYPRWSIFLLCLYGVHLLRRIYECLFVHHWSESARMPIILYLFGMVHYLFVPWSLLPSCLLYNTNNIFTYLAIPLFKLVSINVDDIATIQSMAMNNSSSTWLSSIPYMIVLIRGIITFIVGLGLFIFGNKVQYTVHSQLASLRYKQPSFLNNKLKDDGNDNTIGSSIYSHNNNNYTGYPRTDTESMGEQPNVSRRRTPLYSNNTNNNSNNYDTTGIAPTLFQDIEITPPTTPTETFRNDELFPSSTNTVNSTTTNNTTTSSSEQQYPVPQGGYFNYAICPHYTAEIMIYIGLFMLNNASTLLFGYESVPTCATTTITMISYVDAFSLFRWVLSTPIEQTAIFLLSSIGHFGLVIWVITNLCVTGARTRRWYVETYPQERRVMYTAAVIPYIW